MFLISASLTVYSLQTYRMKKEGHSYAYRDFCSHQEGVWGNGFSDVSWLNFPSWKLPIKTHKIYESAQSNRSLYILSILCIPCQLARALTQGSECLVLDEPTNHLDIKYQLQMESTIWIQAGHIQRARPGWWHWTTTRSSMTIGQHSWMQELWGTIRRSIFLAHLWPGFCSSIRMAVLVVHSKET